MIFMVEEKAKPISKLDEELANLVPVKPGAKKELKPKAPRQRKKVVVTKKIVLSRGKRKEAIARAVLRPGNGTVTVNGVNINMLQPKQLRELILEPTKFAGADTIAKSSDIEINVEGGGVSGQAQAARTAIAKAISKASGSEVLRGVYMNYDRSLLVDDYRRVEPKKFLGTKARARFQKSYR